MKIFKLLNICLFVCLLILLENIILFRPKFDLNIFVFILFYVVWLIAQEQIISRLITLNLIHSVLISFFISLFYIFIIVKTRISYKIISELIRLLLIIILLLYWREIDRITLESLLLSVFSLYFYHILLPSLLYTYIVKNFINLKANVFLVYIHYFAIDIIAKIRGILAVFYLNIFLSIILRLLIWLLIYQLESLIFFFAINIILVICAIMNSLYKVLLTRAEILVWFFRKFDLKKIVAEEQGLLANIIFLKSIEVDIMSANYHDLAKHFFKKYHTILIINKIDFFKNVEEKALLINDLATLKLINKDSNKDLFRYLSYDMRYREILESVISAEIDDTKKFIFAYQEIERKGKLNHYIINSSNYLLIRNPIWYANINFPIVKDFFSF